MDLEARVTALEDEVGILKGEIKAVLLEVRTAFLARSNPFTGPTLTMAAPAPMPEVQTTANVTESIVINEPAAPVFEPAPRHASRAMEPVVTKTTVIERMATQTRFEMNTLAMLMAWTQGNMARLDLSEMGSLLALARYGGVIEPELEQILMDIADHFEHDLDPRTGEPRIKARATISEYLLALHELNSVVNEQDEPAFRWLRKIA
jgi:hypothetical protein